MALSVQSLQVCSSACPLHLLTCTAKKLLNVKDYKNTPKVVCSNPVAILWMTNVNDPICKTQVIPPLHFPMQVQITDIWEVSWKLQEMITSITARHEMQYYYNNNGTHFRLLHFSGHQPKTLAKHNPSGDEKSLQCNASSLIQFIYSPLCCAKGLLPSLQLPRELWVPLLP